MREGLDMNEVLSLAKTMEVKFTVSGPAIGGAKSGINFNPRDPRKQGVEAQHPCFFRTQAICYADIMAGSDFVTYRLRGVAAGAKQIGVC